MLELKTHSGFLYNEQVRDLLSKDNPKGGLQIRQNPKLGMFYVENLKKVPVGSYKEIERRMEQGQIVWAFQISMNFITSTMSK
jgi:hypothetical protein